VVIKLLGARDSLAERLQVSSITLHGFQRKSALDVSWFFDVGRLLYCHQTVNGFFLCVFFFVSVFPFLILVFSFFLVFDLRPLSVL